MIPLRRGLPLLLVLSAVSVPQGCGKKGPPLAPLVIVPGQIASLSAYRLGSAIYAQFTIPSQNQDGSGPADIVRVELYGLTMNPVGGEVGEREFLEHAMLVTSIDVRPPPPDDEPAEAPPEVGDERPGQGEVVTVVEPLSPAILIPVEPEESDAPAVEPTLEENESVRVTPLVLPVTESRLRRSYLAVSFSRRGRRGPSSARVAVSLSEPPPPPLTPSLQYTETVIRVEWQPPEGARRFVQEPASAGVLQGRPILSWPPASTYNVYEVVRGSNAPRTRPVPLNANPLGASSYQDARVEFGVERCYAVRTVDTLDGLRVQSEASSLACVTPKDTFPPAAPNGLIAIGSERTISLIWGANTEEDLAGYLILRGQASDETLQRLTQAPIFETTYLDTTVQPGVRYAYAIVAVDASTPSNESPPSDRVEELAR